MTTTSGYDQASDSAARSPRARVPVPTFDARVMVVENHEDTRLMLRTVLEMRGVSVVEAVNGEMAVALAGSTHLDLVLMDTDLPLLDGYAATRRLRQLGSMLQVPVIILSGHAQPAAEAEAFAAGCTEYLVKPFALSELGGLLERHLSQGTAH